MPLNSLYEFCSDETCTMLSADITNLLITEIRHRKLDTIHGNTDTVYLLRFLNNQIILKSVQITQRSHDVDSTLYLFGKGHDADNVILMSHQRCFTNVVPTPISQRGINVVFLLNVEKSTFTLNEC